MKKILVDLYKIKNEYSGLGQFSVQFANYLSEHYSHEFEFHFLVPRKHNLTFSPLIKLKKVNPILRWWKSSHEQYDLWHSLYQFAKHKPPSEFKQLLTIHDLNFLIEKDIRKKTKYLNRLKEEVNNAFSVTAISSFTKSQILANIPENKKPIEVIYNGLNYLPDVKATRPSYAKVDKFFFAISLFSRKKNFDTLLPVMKSFPDTKLIIAGDHNNDYGNEIKSKIQTLGLQDQVILPGRIPESEKVYLYQFCNAFMCPSLAEGFGLPVIEAMQFGKPVFLSDKTSLPEIGGVEAYYFKDFNPKNMVKTISHGLDDYHKDAFEKSLQIKMQAAQFTWKESMERYVDLYRKLTN